MKDKNCSKEESKEIEFTPFRAEKTWSLIKDLSAARIGELANDTEAYNELLGFSSDIKTEVLNSLAKKYSKLGVSTVPADDVLAVLATAVMSVALDLFETSDDFMEYINAPDEDEAVGKPLTHENPSIYR